DCINLTIVDVGKYLTINNLVREEGFHFASVLERCIKCGDQRATLDVILREQYLFLREKISHPDLEADQLGLTGCPASVRVIPPPPPNRRDGSRSESGGGHEPGAVRLLTAGPDLRTMGTRLSSQSIPAQPQLRLGLLEGLHRNVGWKGSEGLLL
ncbi:hypothetical protein STEG23_035568, partial [Scotinomys teguina]